MEMNENINAVGINAPLSGIAGVRIRPQEVEIVPQPGMCKPAHLARNPINDWQHGKTAPQGGVTQI